MTKNMDLRREKEKSGPREESIKCLIFDLEHGFLGEKRQNWVRASGEQKLSNL